MDNTIGRGTFLTATTMTLNTLPTLPHKPSTTEALTQAKDIGLRYNRNYTALRSIRSGLEVKKAMLESLQRQKKGIDEDVERLTAEVPKYEARVKQLEDWCSAHADMPEVSKHAEDLARRIAKLTKELADKRDLIHRLESGLPIPVAQEEEKKFTSNGEVI